MRLADHLPQTKAKYMSFTLHFPFSSLIHDFPIRPVCSVFSRKKKSSSLPKKKRYNFIWYKKAERPLIFTKTLIKCVFTVRHGFVEWRSRVSEETMKRKAAIADILMDSVDIWLVWAEQGLRDMWRDHLSEKEGTWNLGSVVPLTPSFSVSLSRLFREQFW
jgi:hypothetical protein